MTLLLPGALVVAPAPLSAQLSVAVDSEALKSGSVEGALLHPATGRPAAGVIVTVVETGGRTVTDSRGRYVFPELKPGTYTLLATGDGFSRLRITDVVVRPNHSLTLGSQEMPIIVKDGEVQQMAEVVVRARRDQPGEDEPIQTLEAFVTTGSHIKRLDQEKTLPVTVLNKEALAARDASTPVDLLTSLPQVVSVPLNEGATAATSARGDNAAVNLRGAGSGSTLVLLNGRRLVPHPISPLIDEGGVPSMSVNVNQLPSRGIAQIDVLRDGASSIYGSDAVAGVINYIMDLDFRGTEVSTRFGFPEEGAGSEYRGTVRFGEDLLGGRARFVTVLDYYHRDEILLTDRDFSASADHTSVAPAPWTTTFAGNPFDDRTANGLYGNFTTGTLVNGSFVAGRPAGANTGQVASSGLFYLVPVGTGVNGLKSSTPVRTGAEGDYYYNGNVNGFAQPESTRVNWFGQGEYDVTPTLTAFGELSYYYADSRLPGGMPSYSSASDLPLIVAADNPFNPFGTRFVDPTGAPNADGTPRLTGTPSAVRVNYSQLKGLKQGYSDVYSKVYRALAGMRGKIGETWNWESAALYTRGETSDFIRNATRESLLLQAVQDGTINPFGTTFAVEDGALVAKGLYENPADAVPGLQGDFRRDGLTSIASVDLRTSGKLFEMWGNTVSLAGGGEFRHEEYEDERPDYVGLNPPGSGLDPEGNDFLGLSPTAPTYGERDVTSAYLETVVPLVGPQNDIFLVNALEASAAVRYEDYSDFGDVTKPKFGLNWRPVSSVMIRGSYNQGFRAPNMAILNSPDLFRVWPKSDPYRGPVTGLPSDGVATRQLIFIGNPNLKAEESTGRSAGIVVDVPKIQGLSFSVDYWEIEQENVIVSPYVTVEIDDYNALIAATQAALAAGTPLDQIDLGSGTANYKGAPGMIRNPVTDADRAAFAAYNATRPASQQLAPVGSIAQLRSQYVNRAAVEISGFDFGVNYQTKQLPIGRFLFNSDWSYLRKYEIDQGPGLPLDNAHGEDGATRVRGNVVLTWRKGPWTASASAYYTGEFQDTTATTNAATYESLGQPDYIAKVFDKGVFNYRYIVDDTVTYNASVGYRFTGDTHRWLAGTHVRLGVVNLTNEEPPLSSDARGYPTAVYSGMAVGRTWSVELTKTF
ncbi:MAG TPA: TonB-dependent receptor [Opitutaceae bacterium]